jgi:orotate phosphoribosyltransferase
MSEPMTNRGVASLSALQQQFIQRLLQREALLFGDFQLKSGRHSHFFFNLGKLMDGQDLLDLGQWYAQCLVASGLDFDSIFGPAYKGIPLAAAAVMGLASVHQRHAALVYNRKEAKAHGEGGQWVGQISGRRHILIDDVLTVGTAIHQSAELITSQGGTLVALMVGLDRQAQVSPQQTAAQQLAQRWQVPVLSLVSLTDIADYLEAQQQKNSADRLRTEILSYSS